MGLSAFFSKPKSDAPTTRLFIALLLTDSTVQAGFWQIGQDRISILERSGVGTYTDSNSLLVEADKVLQELGKASENVEEVIFGLELNWVTQEGIADDKKPILKRLTQELSLKPVGFVVSTEALFHFLAAQDTQLSTLLIQYAQDHVTVSIISRGKLLKSERVGRSDDAGADVQEATARLLAQDEHGVLPPRIHLVSAMVGEAELKEQKHNLATFDWKTINPQIDHQPLVEILPAETVLEAVVQEGGKAVAEAQGYQIHGALEKRIAATPEVVDAEEEQPMLTPPEPFISDELVVPTAESISGDFVVPEYAEANPSPNATSPVDSAISSSPRPNPLGGLQGRFQKMLNTSRVRTRQPRLTSSGAVGGQAVNWMQHHVTFMVVGFIAGLLGLAVIGFVTLLGAKKAIANLTLNAKTVSADVNITLDPSIAASEPEKLLLKATLAEETFSEQKTANTSGVTLVGDKAKGKVTFSNKSNEAKTVPAGTQLQSGGVTFTLDAEVSVASASVTQSSQGETKTYGKAEGMVTASKIGAEGNLAAQKSMVVGNFAESTLVAETAAAFSGGSSREVRVFSKEDSDKLVAEVSKAILDKATEQYKQNSPSGQYTLPTGQLTSLKPTFDAKVGDEVDSITLTLEAKVPAVTYQIADVKSLVSVALAGQIPEGHRLSEKDPTILSQPSSQSAQTARSTRVILNTNITAQAVPSIDQDAFKREIAGQSPSSAEAILRGKSEVKEVSVELTPALARTLSNVVPKNTEMIEVVIKN
jgi:hypothetical protein